MRTFVQQSKAPQQATPAKSTFPAHAHLGQRREVSSFLRLQHTIGNQAAQRILQANPDPTPRENKTGIPDNLKLGIESLSGVSMDDVKVHYNSSQPAQVNALAYAQGSDIHVAPGQEQHLPHEAWHVVQQAQGRVRPTMQMKDGVPVNDDQGLEQEADVMGGRAADVIVPATSVSLLNNAPSKGHPSKSGLLQRRTIRREYSTTETEQGPLCDVTLTITGAPSSGSPSVSDFVDAAMDGIRSACGSLGGRARRRLRVTMPYQRGRDHGQISNQAYSAARTSVLGPSAVPPTVAQGAGPATASSPTPTPAPTPAAAPPAPAPIPSTPGGCSPSRALRSATGCTPNPHGSHLPDMGATHTESHALQPCLLTQAAVAASPNWCVDGDQAHGGEVCYRQIPSTSGGPAAQYCYSLNCCHNSADVVSHVQPTSPGSNSCCETNNWALPGHFWNDVVPELLDDPVRVIRDVTGL